jgi:Tol biopolymer transport system component
MNSDGNDQTRLTDNVADDISPTWSPDGKQIAFTSGRDGNYEIYLMNADGSNQLRLTYVEAYDWFADWSR